VLSAVLVESVSDPIELPAVPDRSPVVPAIEFPISVPPPDGLPLPLPKVYELTVLFVVPPSAAPVPSALWANALTVHKAAANIEHTTYALLGNCMRSGFATHVPQICRYYQRTLFRRDNVQIFSRDFFLLSSNTSALYGRSITDAGVSSFNKRIVKKLVASHRTDPRRCSLSTG